MLSSFRTRLKGAGEPLIGTLVTLSSPAVAEILAEVGFDWLFVDLEHATMEVADAQALLQAAGERADCVLRIPLNDEIWIKKALDTGAAGIIVPQVNTAEDARRAVACAKYPPQGRRSIGLARAQGYGARLQEYLEHANADTAVIVQIETAEAVRNVEEIAAVEGVDVLFVGPYDLSASLGRMGQVGDVQVTAAIARVQEVGQRAGLPLGIYAGTAETARDYADQGYRLIAVGSDTTMLAQASKQALNTFVHG